VIGEQGAVRALLRYEPFERGPLIVELREREPTSDPRSGLPVPVPPLVVLWEAERPCAVRVRSLVAVSRFPSSLRLAALLEADAEAGGLMVERVWEAALWRLFASPPPRPRLIHRPED
jgi:hypothetical protein